MVRPREISARSSSDFSDSGIEIFTDASKTGWGASWNDKSLSGQLSSTESRNHINWLELLTVRLTILQWAPQPQVRS